MVDALFLFPTAKQMKQRFYTFFVALLAVFLLYPSLAMAKTNMGTIYMKVGESRQLTSEPSTYYTVTGEWSKTGDAIRITSSGNRSCTISALRVGTATVTWIGYIDTTWEEMYWTIYVEADDIKVTSISLDKTSLTLPLGKDETLTATVLPTNATNKTVSWTTSNSSVATVSSAGKVTAVAQGTATITCKANDGSGVSTSCAVFAEELPNPLDYMKGDIKQVSAGGCHTMILMKDGSLWACGLNSDGQLGDGTTISRNTPTLIMTDVAEVSAGHVHTMIVKKDGTLWACGDNGSGRLGNGSSGRKETTPIQVMSNVTSVSAGEDHTMILKNDGSLWACGGNDKGQLGDGSSHEYPTRTPKQIMTNVLAVSAGDAHTMILKTNGSLWACGWNCHGQLCDGTTIDCSTPKQVMTNVAMVEAGSGHSMILKTDGSLWACGGNTKGELGDGTTTEQKVPKLVMTDVRFVSSEWGHTMMLKTDGTVWACGDNENGQLGDGSSKKSSMPKQVMTDVVAVETARYHTLFLKDDGTLWSCGRNYNGELGDGTNIDKYTPVMIAGIIGVTSITLSKTKLSLHPGQTETLTATVKPDNATDKTVTWSSSNTSVATVSSTGKVTAKAKGSATITCKANDGSGKQDACEVTVTPILPESISLPSTMTVAAGQTVTLTPTITPADAVTTLTWSSDDETIATVNSSGVVTGVKKGQTFINVETDNGKTAYCKLTVTAGEPTEIILPKNVTVTIGKPLTITATVIPEGAETTLTWKSDDETIVRVNGSGALTGLLTGLAEGLAIVTVSTSNGLTSNACKVKVEPDPSGINDVQMAESNNAPVFTLSGQRLAAPKKGINIVGGKKMVVK